MDKQVPDSASTATAIFCGVKTNNKVSGVDANVRLEDCEASLNEDYHLDSIIAWGQAAGKDTGIKTSLKINVKNEMIEKKDSKVDESFMKIVFFFFFLQDLLRRLESLMQLLRLSTLIQLKGTGNANKECQKVQESVKTMQDNLSRIIPEGISRYILIKSLFKGSITEYQNLIAQVIMGGGRQLLQSNITATDNDPIDTWACYSQDGRKLLDEWSADKSRRKFSNVVVQNNEELFQVDTDNTDFLLGIFSNGHMSMDWQRNKGPRGQPSLENMTTTAIKILKNSEKGFVLVARISK